jgi:hypothetical protein
MVTPIDRTRSALTFLIAALPYRSGRSPPSICGSSITIQSCSRLKRCGTDHPFPWDRTALDHILATPGVSDADRVAMQGDTASRLLGIKPG